MDRIIVGGRHGESLVAKDPAYFRWLKEHYRGADIFFAIDHCPLSLTSILRDEVPFHKVLVRAEPRIAQPNNRYPAVVHRYDAVVDLGNRTLPFPLIQEQSIGRNELFEKNRMGRFVSVSSDKVSFGRGELYSLRREVALASNLVDLWGRGWEKTASAKLVAGGKAALHSLATDPLIFKPLGFKLFFSNIPNMGPVDDKVLLMSEYKFALVIENSISYHSEKVFDALKAGCVPVYVGGELPDEVEPFVIRSKENLADVLTSLEKALSLTDAEIQNRRLAFVNNSSEILSRNTPRWLMNYLLEHR